MTAATRVVVSDPPGEPTSITLYAADDEQPIASIAIGPHMAVQVASDLLRSALRRFGRPLIDDPSTWPF